MRLILVVTMAVATCFVITGCAGFMRAPVVPPLAFVYTNTSAPLDVDMDKTTLGSKKGTATVSNVLGLVAFGNASVRAAAQDGGISQINHVDYDFLNVLGVFSRFTTVVYGE